MVYLNTIIHIQAHYNEDVICLKFGTPENIEMIWDEWKIIIFRCPNT